METVVTEQIKEREAQLTPRQKGGGIAVVLMVIPFIVVMFVMVVLPTFGLLLKSFSGDNSLQMILLQPRLWHTLELTTENYVQAFRDPYYQATFGWTLLITLSSVALSLIIGVPTGYLLTRPDLRWRGTLEWILSVPIYAPTVVSSYALLIFFGPYGIVNSVLQPLFDVRLNVIFTIPAVIMGTFYITVPSFIRVVATAFESIPPNLREASLSLGGTEVYTFRRVLIPLALPGILAGALLNFTFAIGLVVVALLIGGGSINVQIIPLEILMKTTGYAYDIPFASSLAFILLFIALIAQFLAMMLFPRRRVF